MRNFALLILTLLCTAKANAQINQMLRFANKVITNRLEPNNKGEWERNYYNYDCIDYVLVRGNDAIYTIRPGKNTLMRLEKKARYNDPWKAYGQNIRIYPGHFTKREEVRDIIYAMPVSNGKTVKCNMQEKKIRWDADTVRLNAMYFKMNSGEIIHAVRSGTACQDVSNKDLYIYHEDGFIAVYNNIDKSVKHSDRIIAGQPIGVVAEGKTNIRLLLLYMFHDKVKVKEDLQFPYKAILPKFRTTDGDIYLDHELKATAQTDNFVKTQEMTSKEKFITKK